MREMSGVEGAERRMSCLTKGDNPFPYTPFEAREMREEAEGEVFIKDGVLGCAREVWGVSAIKKF